MPPPHLAVLNVQDHDDRPVRTKAGWLRAAFTPPAPRVEDSKPAKPPTLAKLLPAVRTRAPVKPVVSEPVATKSDIEIPKPRRVAEPPVTVKLVVPAAPQEDLLADLPPAQVPLRGRLVAPPAPAPRPLPKVAMDDPRPPAAQRAFRIGRAGARPAHAMSAVEIAAWREGAMEAGRARDPIFGRPRLWWWLALSAILLGPMAYAAGWLGMAANGAEFLSSALGQEAWILVGGAEAAWAYWVLLFGVALGLQMLRPLEPVLILCAATWWVWTALHAAWLAGWLAQRIPPLPLPG